MREEVVNFNELEIDENVPLRNLLGSKFILLFISSAHKIFTFSFESILSYL